MISTTRFDTPLGPMLATAEAGALTGLYFTGQRHHPEPSADWQPADDAEPFARVRQQLQEFFAGTRRTFDVPLAPLGGRGTSFQHAVWDAIYAVPMGGTITYATLASACGRPSASRASGAATGRNPISLIIPCHRIVGSDGSLTGYAGGLWRKSVLLAFERAVAGGEAGSIERFLPDVGPRLDTTSDIPAIATTAAQRELALQ